MPRIDFMGCPIDSLTMDQTIALIEEYIAKRKLCQHVVVNVSKFVEMQKDHNLRKIISECDIITPTACPSCGHHACWAYRCQKGVAGIDLFQKLVELSAVKGYRPYFFGARQWVVGEGS